jgi:hypothetical protein
MKKLILNFKSKDSKKIKNPKNFLGGKGANLSEMGKNGSSSASLDLQFRQKFVKFFIKIKKD